MSDLSTFDDLFPETRVIPDSANERFTTRETIEWVKRAIGVEDFDLDVAACVESHWAPRYFTKKDNGLERPWVGDRIWCNPPYDDIGSWVEKAWEEWRSRCAGCGNPPCLWTWRRCCPDCSCHRLPKIIAMLIPATRTDQRWWQDLVEPERDCRDFDGPLETYFLPGRTAFARPGSGGVGQPGSPFGCVLLVWRRP